MAKKTQKNKTWIFVVIPITIIAIVICVLFLLKTKMATNIVEFDNTEQIIQKPTNSITKMTAGEILEKIKEKVPFVDKITVYTTETDPNGALGRPNKYTSKASFSDNRVEQPVQEDLDGNYKENLVGGTIEVFNNNEDCASRFTYINELQKSMPILGSQYIYQYKNILLRVDGDLTPEQAKNYENAFLELQ